MRDGTVTDSGKSRDGYGTSSRLSQTSLNLPHSQRKDVCSTPEDLRARFYEDYRKVAEEYDKEFNKRYDEDLNTTLIFVSLSVPSCLNDTY
jgi:hypothetical protein